VVHIHDFIFSLRVERIQASGSKTSILSDSVSEKLDDHVTDSMLSRKHALTLQLHTAHILSAHASLEQKSKAIQDLKEQKNKYVL
jgi:hypothetical protein